MLQQFFTQENKFFLYLLSQRRNFIPILSIYYLTLPDTTANQIGIFTGLWYFTSFLLEIPSWYIADRIWHRKTLIFSKILQCLSVILFIWWYFIWPDWNFICFILWFIFQSIWFSFFSWTTWAYYHELLEEKGHWHKYGKQMSQLKWKVSLLSAFIIVLLPFLTDFHILWPLIIWLLFDILGTISMILLPNVEQKDESKPQKNIWELLKESKLNRGLYISMFMWLSIGFFMWEHAYRGLYLQHLWYPLVLMWTIMAGSRIVWYIVWKYAHNIEKYISFRTHFYGEMIWFSLALFAIFYFSNPYLVGMIYILMIGYQHGRKPILEHYLLQNYISDKRYKATFLSMESQFSSIVSMVITFAMWYFVAHSFELWYALLTLSLLISFMIIFFLIFRKEKNQA